MTEPIPLRPLLTLVVFGFLAGMTGVVTDKMFGGLIFGLWGIAGAAVVIVMCTSVVNWWRGRRRSHGYHREGY